MNPLKKEILDSPQQNRRQTRRKTGPPSSFAPREGYRGRRWRRAKAWLGHPGASLPGFGQNVFGQLLPSTRWWWGWHRAALHSLTSQHKHLLRLPTTTSPDIKQQSSPALLPPQPIPRINDPPSILAVPYWPSLAWAGNREGRGRRARRGRGYWVRMMEYFPGQEKDGYSSNNKTFCQIWLFLDSIVKKLAFSLFDDWIQVSQEAVNTQFTAIKAQHSGWNSPLLT